MRIPLNSNGGSPFYIVSYVPVLVPVDTAFLDVSIQESPEFGVWVHIMVEKLKNYFQDDSFSHTYEIFLYYFESCFNSTQIRPHSSEEYNKLKTVVFEKLSESVKFDNNGC